MIGFLFDYIGFIWMLLVLVGLILGLQKKKTLINVGKSISCFAFALTNWAVFYNTAYPHDTRRVGTLIIPYLTDIWRWLPAVILMGVLIICLLIIWKPFNNKGQLIAVSGLAGSLIAVSVFAIMTWENFGAMNPQYRYTTAHINYNETFFQEFLRITRRTKEIHLTTSIMAFVAFLCFRKNPIYLRIGKSALCALLLFVVWSAATEYFDSWIWIISIICIIIFLICLFFIWKPFILIKKIAEDKRPFPNGVPKRDKIILATAVFLVLAVTIGYNIKNVIQHMPQRGFGEVTAVYAGFWNSMAITDDGSLWAWGRNMESQLGDGTSESRSRPIKIMDDVVAVSSGMHTLVITGDGSLWAWGNNANGELGIGTNTRSYSNPVLITIP